jgi:hypothetical protein
MVLVFGDGYLALGHAIHQRLGTDGLLCGAGLKKRGYVFIYRIFTYAHAWVSEK